MAIAKEFLEDELKPTVNKKKIHLTNLGKEIPYLEFENLILWVRRRLSMMIMKLWKSWRCLHKQLRRMGYKGSFEKIPVTRWRNSNCTLLHMALPNTWFDEKHLFYMEKVTTSTLHQYNNFVLNKV